MTSFTDGTTSFTVDRLARRKVTPRVLAFDFGDGYTQRIADGINTLNEEYDVTFNNRTNTEVNSIVDFFESTNGVTNFALSFPHLGSLTSTVSLNSGSKAITGSGFNATILSPAVPDRLIIINSDSNDADWFVDKLSTNNDTTITLIGVVVTETSTADVELTAAVSVIVTEWNETYKYPGIYSLTAKLKRVYDL